MGKDSYQIIAYERKKREIEDRRLARVWRKALERIVRMGCDGNGYPVCVGCAGCTAAAALGVTVKVKESM